MRQSKTQRPKLASLPANGGGGNAQRQPRLQGEPAGPDRARGRAYDANHSRAGPYGGVQKPTAPHGWRRRKSKSTTRKQRRASPPTSGRGPQGARGGSGKRPPRDGNAGAPSPCPILPCPAPPQHSRSLRSGGPNPGAAPRDAISSLQIRDPPAALSSAAHARKGLRPAPWLPAAGKRGCVVGAAINVEPGGGGGADGLRHGDAMVCNELCKSNSSATSAFCTKDCEKNTPVKLVWGASCCAKRRSRRCVTEQRGHG